jgi:hypothetical protein
MERHVIRRDENFGQPRVQSQEPYRVGFSSNNSFRNDGGNIFLKSSQNSFQSGSQNSFQSGSQNANNANSEKSELNKIVLNDDDNFPSLGSNSTKVNKPGSVQNKLDFKKVVEKKPEVVNKTEPKVMSTQYKKCNYKQYSLYQEIREQSERNAKLKMVDDISSDDNGDDNYY